VRDPNNVVLIDEFSKIFDGFSIGSNDLTQLTLAWIATRASSRSISTNAMRASSR